MSDANGPEQAALFEGDVAPARTGREHQEWLLSQGWAPNLKFRGRTVPARVATDACELHATFCRLAEMSLPRFQPDGRASDSLTRIVGALLSHEDVSFKDWCHMVELTIAHPWTPDGTISIGMVFGPRVVDENLANPMRGKREVKNGRTLTALRAMAAT